MPSSAQAAIVGDDWDHPIYTSEIIWEGLWSLWFLFLVLKAVKDGKVEYEIYKQKKALVGDMTGEEIETNYYFENNVKDGVPDVKMYKKSQAMKDRDRELESRGFFTPKKEEKSSRDLDIFKWYFFK